MSNRGAKQLKVAWGASRRLAPREAVYEAWRQVLPGVEDPSLFLCFFTPNYFPDQIFAEFNFLLERFPGWCLAGLSSAGVLSPRGVCEQGLVVLRLSGAGLVAATSLARLERWRAFRYGQEAGRNLQEDGIASPGTIFLFYDSYAEGITPFLWGLYDALGPGFAYVGGGGVALGKGSIQLTEKGWTSGGAVVAGVKGLEVTALADHGWRPCSNPFFITQAQGRVVKGIDGFPARDLYLKLAGVKGCSVAEVGWTRPLGFPRLTGDFLLRDPLKELPDGSIEFVSEVPAQGAAFLMEASGLEGVTERVVRRGLALLGAPLFALLVCCFSNYRLVGARAVSMPRECQGMPWAGFLSLGEIAATGGVPLVQNRTVALALGR
ncbi:FIST signal transduction protein [Desulfothermobacter acidiphilus]|uniref:FIST signal transduction protein n=1 Tax=Desulfothermobacter acidiphilus TaxID=1938353 RepID=UPI003F8B068E